MDRSLQWSNQSVSRIKEGPGTLAGSLIARIEKILSEQPAGGISGTWVWNPIWSGVEIWPLTGIEQLPVLGLARFSQDPEQALITGRLQTLD